MQKNTVRATRVLGTRQPATVTLGPRFLARPSLSRSHLDPTPAYFLCARTPIAMATNVDVQQLKSGEVNLGVRGCARKG